MGKRVVMVAVMIGLLSVGVGSSFAGTLGQSDDTQDRMFRKLGRGVGNAATGWMEIFNQMHLKFEEEPNKGKAAFVGLFKGLGYAIARSVAGAYEIVSFPVPIPAEYKSPINPPLLFSPDQSEYQYSGEEAQYQ